MINYQSNALISGDHTSSDDNPHKLEFRGDILCVSVTWQCRGILVVIEDLSGLYVLVCVFAHGM